MDTILIPLDELAGDPGNPRAVIDSADLETSIPVVGLLAPLLVAADPDGTGPTPWLVVAGNRRLQALQRLSGLGKLPAELQAGIPCIKVKETDAPAVAAIENSHRKALDAFEEADAIERMLQAGMKPAAIGKALRQPKAWVEQRRQLCRVVPSWRQAIRAGRATWDTATWVGTRSAEQQEELLATLSKARGGATIEDWAVRGRMILCAQELAGRLDKLGAAYTRDLFSGSLVVEDFVALRARLVADWVAENGWPADKPVPELDVGGWPTKGETHAAANDATRVALYFDSESLSVEPRYFRSLASGRSGQADAPAELPPLALQAMPQSIRPMVDATHVAAAAAHLAQDYQHPRQQAATALAGLVDMFNMRGRSWSAEVYGHLLATGAPTHDGERIAGLIVGMLQTLAGKAIGPVKDRFELDSLLAHAHEAMRAKPRRAIDRLARWLPDGMVFRQDFTAAVAMLTLSPDTAASLARSDRFKVADYADSSCGFALDRAKAAPLRAWLEAQGVAIAGRPGKAELVKIARTAKLPPPPFLEFDMAEEMPAAAGGGELEAAA